MPVGGLAAFLAGGQERLQAAGIETARLDAEVLMAHSLGIERGRLALLLSAGPGGSTLTPASRAQFLRLVDRRTRREPIAYLIGHREFWSLDFEVNPAVLVPRPETELVVEVSLERLAAGAPCRVLDVGTGSGAIAVAIAAERPRAWVLAIDRSEEALAVARRNARRHKVGLRVCLVAMDLGSALADAAPEGFDLLASNPPYVADDERTEVMPDVLEYEPHDALFSGPSGMETIERLIPDGARLLRPGGHLVMEVAAARATRTAGLLSEAGSWSDVTVHDDLAGLPRVVSARRAGAVPVEDAPPEAGW